MILKRPQMTSSKFFISSPCLGFILRLRFTISPFPTHSPANGYLPCWKGLRFLTGEIDNRTAAKKSQAASGKEAGANGRKERKIYHWCRSPRRHRLSLPLSLTAVMEVKVWPQTVRGEKKELHVNICSHRLPGLKKIHYILLVFFPPQSQFKSSTFVWDQEDFRESPGRKQTERSRTLRKGLSLEQRG